MCTSDYSVKSKAWLHSCMGVCPADHDHSTGADTGRRTPKRDFVCVSVCEQLCVALVGEPIRQARGCSERMMTKQLMP
jgi:hypothetical protein